MNSIMKKREYINVPSELNYEKYREYLKKIRTTHASIVQSQKVNHLVLHLTLITFAL